MCFFIKKCLLFQQIYDWNNKSMILSSFFWAYIVFQIFAGYLGRKYGTKKFLLGTVFIDSTACILIPIVAEKFGAHGVMVCQIIEGLMQGFLFPSVHNIIGSWVPPSERSLLSTTTYIGKLSCTF